jgi:hypothetical protein
MALGFLDQPAPLIHRVLRLMDVLRRLQSKDQDISRTTGRGLVWQLFFTHLYGYITRRAEFWRQPVCMGLTFSHLSSDLWYSHGCCLCAVREKSSIPPHTIRYIWDGV